MMEDLNARTLITGDHKKNTEGEGLMQFTSNHNLDILSESLAHSQYASVNNNNGTSIIGMARNPTEQQSQWESLEVIPTPTLINTAAHNTIIATSYRTIQTTRVMSSHQYTINYNDHGACCLRQQCNNKIANLQTTILNEVKHSIPQEYTPCTTKIMETI